MKQAKSTVRLTEARVRDLPEGVHYDAVENGLVLYVGKRTRTFGLYTWNPMTQKPIRKALGRHPLINVDEARKRCRAAMTKLHDGVPLDRPSRVTLKLVSDKYEARNRARGDRDCGWLANLVRRGFPDWLDRDLSTITRAEVADRHDLIATERGRTAAARTVKGLSSLFRFADTLDLYVGRNPAAGIEVRGSQPRSRYLSREEAARLDAALDDPSLSPWTADYFRLLAATGVRRSNLAAAKWADIDLDAALWRIPAADFKTGQETLVHLTAKAVEILRARKEAGGEWVFPSHSATGHIVDPWFQFQEVLKLAGISGVTLHDLRRTKAVRLTEMGAPLTVVAAALGHRNPQTTARVYALATSDSVKEWVNRS